MRLIDADALKKEVKTLFCPDGYKIMMLERIDNAPTVEPPKGEWIDVNGDGSLWKCNNCGEKSCCKGNYCPDCGADMQKGGAE